MILTGPGGGAGWAFATMPASAIRQAPDKLQVRPVRTERRELSLNNICPRNDPSP